MDSADFGQMWSQLVTERRELTEHRTTLENDLMEVRNKISCIDEIIKHLEPLSDLGVFFADDVSSLGLTDAIRRVLKESKLRMSADEVRQTLTERGYDLSRLSSPMASIYKILGRLSDGDSAELQRTKEDGRVFYKTKITDEAVPF